MRLLHPDTKAALDEGEYEIASLIKLEFSTEINLTDYGHSIDWDGDTYSADGQILQAPEANETSDIEVNETSITLSGVDQSFYSVFITDNPINRVVQYRKVVMIGGVIQGDPLDYLVNGRITEYEFDESEGVADITVNIANHWKDFEKKSGRNTTPASQAKFYSGDKGMDYAGSQGADVPWGKE